MGTNHISGTAEATVVKFCLQVGDEHHLAWRVEVADCHALNILFIGPTWVVFIRSIDVPTLLIAV